MVTATAEINQPVPAPKTVEPHQAEKVSLEYFLAHFSEKEDGFKYEFNNGIIEKTAAMNPAQAFIIANLHHFFYSLKPNAGGSLLAELNQLTSATQLRRPDLSYLTKDQLSNARNGEKVVAQFMVEIISETDQVNPVSNKIFEYFDAGVKVVWLIHPVFEMVHVYTSPVHMKICKGKTICSAEPVIPGFKLSAEAVFKSEQ